MLDCIGVPCNTLLANGNGWEKRDVIPPFISTLLFYIYSHSYVKSACHYENIGIADVLNSEQCDHRFAQAGLLYCYPEEDLFKLLNEVSDLF